MTFYKLPESPVTKLNKVKDVLLKHTLYFPVKIYCMISGQDHWIRDSRTFSEIVLNYLLLNRSAAALMVVRDSLRRSR